MVDVADEGERLGPQEVSYYGDFLEVEVGLGVHV